MKTTWCSDLLFVLLCLVLAALPASATLSIGESELTFGGSSQDKITSIGESVTLTKSFSLSASPNGYDNLQWSFTPQNNFPQGNIVLVGLGQSINGSNGSQSLSITVNLTIPRDFDAVNSGLEETDFDIGTLTVTGINTTIVPPDQGQDTLPLKLQVDNEITLEKIELKREDGSVSDVTSSSTVEVQANQDVEFIFYVKNTFSNGTNVEFSDGEIRMDIEDVDDDSATFSNVDPGETKSKEISFTLDEDELGNFDVVVEIEATDEFGGLHGLKKEFTLDVNPAPQQPADSDGDGISDTQDQCGNTPPYCTVNGQGCPLDKDSDGICDAIDTIDNTAIIPAPAPQQGQNTASPVKKTTTNTTSTSTGSKKKVDEGTLFLTFFIGFVAGALIASGFFFFLRSP